MSASAPVIHNGYFFESPLDSGVEVSVTKEELSTLNIKLFWIILPQLET
tara:strand:+ start:340 stop:486 length:147 start_codon:yes stop_codon:yes gene_type:complete